MPTPKVESVRHLKNAGVFSDINIGAFPHTFRNFNLIYGFNGCGKTTLSRLLGMLSEDRINENLPDNAEFSFVLSDGSSPSHDNLDCALNRHISDDPNGFERFAYLMPNAIRKVLDIFLAFKDPGCSGLEPKVDKIIKDYPALDGARVKAMERLAQIESHSESIGDVTTFSAYTLHQVSDAASCLMALINEVDPIHKKAMDGLC